MTLEGKDADKFDVELDTSGAKPVIRLTLLDGQDYATNVTYKVRFNLSVCGQDILSSVMNVRVTQKRSQAQGGDTGKAVSVADGAAGQHADGDGAADGGDRGRAAEHR